MSAALEVDAKALSHRAGHRITQRSFPPPHSYRWHTYDDVDGADGWWWLWLMVDGGGCDRSTWWVVGVVVIRSVVTVVVVSI